MNFSASRFLLARTFGKDLLWKQRNSVKYAYTSKFLLNPQESFLHTSPSYTTSNDDQLYTIEKPFKYVSQALKVLSKIRDFDSKFDEFDFLDGSKQAILYVSEKLAAGEFNDLRDVVTVNGMETLMEIYNQESPNTAFLKVEESDVIVVVPASFKKGVNEDGAPCIYILVDCCCKDPRIIQCSFQRKIDHSDSQWLIDSLNYLEGVKK